MDCNITGLLAPALNARLYLWSVLDPHAEASRIAHRMCAMLPTIQIQRSDACRSKPSHSGSRSLVLREPIRAYDILDSPEFRLLFPIAWVGPRRVFLRLRVRAHICEETRRLNSVSIRLT
jgi:hypothetical protein